jgi:hypothetical protein
LDLDEGEGTEKSAVRPLFIGIFQDDEIILALIFPQELKDLFFVFLEISQKIHQMFIIGKSYLFEIFLIILYIGETFVDLLFLGLEDIIAGGVCLLDIIYLHEELRKVLVYGPK